MADEFGAALRASCAFVSHIMLADRVLPHIEDSLPATRTRKVCRHSDTGPQGMYPAATQTPETRLPAAPRRSVRRTRNLARGRGPRRARFRRTRWRQFDHANDGRPCARPLPARDETHKLWLGDPLSSRSPAAPANPARVLRRAPAALQVV